MISLRTRIAESAGEMDRLSRLWGEMLVVTPHSIFQRYGWNRLAAQVFRDRLTPAVVAVESDSGAAIVPAAVHHKARRLGTHEPPNLANPSFRKSDRSGIPNK